MLKKEYIKKIKDVLIKDLNTKSDLSPNGMFAINEISEEYKGKIQQSVIDMVTDISKWLESYFMHCHHMNRPVDDVIANHLIGLLDYI